MRKAMDTKKRKTESAAWVDRVHTLVTMSAAAATLATVIGIITGGLLGDHAGGSPGIARPAASIVVWVAAIGVTTAFTFALARRERGSSRVAKLKDEITDAYLDALDSSRLNPLGRGEL
jgi:hypothetical protein